MHIFFRSLALFVVIVACNQETPQERTTEKAALNLSDINLVIKSNTPIDSIWIADIGQKESIFLPFQDTIKINFKRSISDRYIIYAHQGEKRIGTQFWLDGDQVIIDMIADNKNLTLQEVHTSPLYKASLAYTKKYQQLIKTSADSMAIDEFLIAGIRDHLDTPLSHTIVGDFLDRNQNNRKKVDKVYRILRTQTDSIQSHFTSHYDRMKSILDVEAVKFDQYDLGDIHDQKINISLDASKQYLLDFWFLRCAPCIRDHKRIAANYDIFENNNIELISISRDDHFKSWSNYLNKNNYEWLNVREQKPEKRLTYDLSIWSYPNYTLIDHKGSIQTQFSSFAQFENYINKKQQH